MLTFSLTVVRHGETQYNKEKLLQGQGVDTSLSEPGLQQAEAAGLYLRELRFSNVFVSNLQRARQTAEIIMRNNVHSSGVEMVFDPLLRERGFGIAEGRPKEDLKNMANAAGQSCRDYTPPGGETLEQVRLRCKKFLKSLYQRMVDDHGCSGQSSAAVGTEAGASAAESGTDGPLAGLPDDGMEGVPLHALVVSHGAYIRVAVRHFVEDLQCSLPQGLKMSKVLSACPNTGISRFVLTVSPSESGLTLSAVRCVFTNRKDHLTSRNICYITH
ncbi:fructose-2,6-bisphosphatase TIGAR B [Salmo salar]|uniref:fructose-2,6-bisphosphate 2-phosphatase n=1 Tax=Salmo salar TaxID=8030 RepID=A0A1S3SHJ6_SALSA|nr:fructose-2,6-bisphosphatase TIGAR B-like [Salmo salar]|eukprot:XP_014063801.1 PREDICTED: fructose-2,6-bisphosphatase TIGAR B-like [Salmo salar]